MSIGNNMNSTGISVRSPSNVAKGRNNNNMEDVELGSSSHGHQRRLKAKDSDIEMTALISSNGDSKSPIMSPRSANASASNSGDGAESGSFTKSLIASAMYSGCSVGMVLVNKSLASRYA
jgi:hypothetical protein